LDCFSPGKEYIDLEALVSHVRDHPETEAALQLQEKRGADSLEEQLSSRPLVLGAIKHAAGSLESVLVALGLFQATAPLEAKLALIFSSIDEDGSGSLTRDEIRGVLAKCVEGETAMVVALAKLEESGLLDECGGLDRAGFVGFAGDQAAFPELNAALSIQIAGSTLTPPNPQLQASNAASEEGKVVPRRWATAATAGTARRNPGAGLRAAQLGAAGGQAG